MTPTERRATSLIFAERSDHEFDHGGNTMIAAELLWGAIAHILIAIAETNQWRCEGHKGFIQVANKLHHIHPDKRWTTNVAAADELHRHFYNQNLGERRLDSNRAAARRALDNAFALLPEP